MKSLTSILPALALGLATPTHAEIHALILTIGQYKAGVPPLRGVQYDAESARAIARRMGVMDANMRHYKDDELTIDGMRRVFDELQERVGQGDQVFIYYSGHGGRGIVKDPEERCAESLITVDGYGFPDVEIEQHLKRLSSRAQKLVVLLDACHSGGVTTRSVPGRSAQFSAKYYSPRGASDACERPVNVVTRLLGVQSRSVGTGANNYIYIAAARNDEVSLDQPGKGGVATQAWRDCITGAAIDRDGSGGLSAEEIRICAQDRINTTLKNVPGFLPHNVTISGNSGAVLAFAERTGNAAAAAAPVAPPAAAPAAVPPPAPGGAVRPSQMQALPSAYYTLQDIYNSRDDRRVVSLQTTKAAFRIGQDDVGFVLQSSHAGYAYMLMVGSDGKTFDMLFPNQIDQNNYIEAGQTVRLPRAAWQIKAGGPPGKNYLLTIVADAQRDYSKIGMQPAGPFSMVSANATSSKDIQLVSGTSAQSSSGDCSIAPARRTLQIQQRCSNAYGAAMTVLEEIN